MGPIEAIVLGYTVGSIVYHRWKDAKKPWPTTTEVMNVPATEAGGSLPLVFGRCRINRPAIMWSGNLTGEQDVLRAEGFFIYEGDALYALGIPFLDGVTKLESIFIRGQRIQPANQPNGLSPNLGVGVLPSIAGPLPSTSPDFARVSFEFGGGTSTQDLGTGSNTATRMAAAGVATNTIPGFRGVATVLARLSVNQPEIPALAFEISTYSGATIGKIGEEANPVSVIQAILCDRFGKLGLSFLDAIDNASFLAAAQTLVAEQHGYSRAFEDRMTASEMIEEVLRQIDGVLYEEPRTGKTHIKLIRADYDPTTILRIMPSNCIRIDGFNAGWGDNVINRVVVSFANRGNDFSYFADQAVAQNPANAVGQDGITREVVLEYPGCHTTALAEELAARELGARSQPTMTCRATVNRSFWNVRPGDPVSVTWPNYHISNVVFRVAHVDRGAVDTPIVLDLIQDAFYVYRRRVQTGGLTPDPTPGILDPG